MHNYYNMHDTVIMHGCIIVFMLDYLIIQQGGLFKKGSISVYGGIMYGGLYGVFDLT